MTRTRRGRGSAPRLPPEACIPTRALLVCAAPFLPASPSGRSVFPSVSPRECPQRSNDLRLWFLAAPQCAQRPAGALSPAGAGVWELPFVLQPPDAGRADCSPLRGRVLPPRWRVVLPGWLGDAGADGRLTPQCSARRETQRREGAGRVHLRLPARQVRAPVLQDPPEPLPRVHQALRLRPLPQEAHPQERLLRKCPPRPSPPRLPGGSPPLRPLWGV